jgi:hypothetical protein
MDTGSVLVAPLSGRPLRLKIVRALMETAAPKRVELVTREKTRARLRKMRARLSRGIKRIWEKTLLFDDNASICPKSVKLAATEPNAIARNSRVLALNVKTA